MSQRLWFAVRKCLRVWEDKKKRTGVGHEVTASKTTLEGTRERKMEFLNSGAELEAAWESIPPHHEAPLVFYKCYRLQNQSEWG